MYVYDRCTHYLGTTDFLSGDWTTGTGSLWGLGYVWGWQCKYYYYYHRLEFNGNLCWKISRSLERSLREKRNQRFAKGDLIKTWITVFAGCISPIFNSAGKVQVWPPSSKRGGESGEIRARSLKGESSKASIYTSLEANCRGIWPPYLSWRVR